MHVAHVTCALGTWCPPRSLLCAQCGNVDGQVSVPYRMPSCSIPACGFELFAPFSPPSAACRPHTVSAPVARY